MKLTIIMVGVLFFVFGYARAETSCPVYLLSNLEAMSTNALINLLEDYSAKVILYSADKLKSLEKANCRLEGLHVANVINDRLSRSRSVLHKQPIMDLDGIANGATGKRKDLIENAKVRILKNKILQICPVFTDSELEALIIDSKDFEVLRYRYGDMSGEASTLGNYTNMKVMRDCEKQARRILFYWDNHKRDAAVKRLSN